MKGAKPNAERPPASSHPADAAYPGIGVPPGAVLGVEPRRRHPRAVITRETRHIVNVINVTVRQQDSLDGKRIPPSTPQRSLQGRHAADKASVDKIEAFRVAQDMEADERSANLKDVVYHQCNR